jgi:NAD(P)-dependent dehydrogenase (short-subunit alcohol dehydrogenase family)
MLRVGRWNKVETQSQTGKWLRHYNQYRMAILITGAAGGLGRAVVDAFLATGATVYGADVSWKHQPHTNANFHPIEANRLQADECERVAKMASPVEALLHLIGAIDGPKPVEETPDDVWQRMLDFNLRSAYIMFRAVLPQMTEAGHGRIVAVGSRAVLEPMANFAAYNAAKAALVALVKTIAVESRDAGVTANVVLPSIIDTPGNRASMSSADYSKWVTPESIASLMVWLLSDAARSVSGAAIPIYGGV